MTVGERDAWTSSKRAPWGRFTCRICCDSERGLLLYLAHVSLLRGSKHWGVYFSVNCSLPTPNFWHASSRTSVRYFTGVVGILWLLADALYTTTCDIATDGGQRMRTGSDGGG